MAVLYSKRLCLSIEGILFGGLFNLFFMVVCVNKLIKYCFVFMMGSFFFLFLRRICLFFCVFFSVESSIRSSTEVMILESKVL